MKKTGFKRASIHVAIAMIAVATSVSASPFVHRQEINAGWKFKEARKTQWHPATVPGTVHTDLMAEKILPDPFIAENERSVQWVDKEDWIYETVFDLDSASLGKSRIDLVFNGLDTYADVYLNDSLLLNADNMFRTWRVPVEGLVNPEGNRLRVFFHSPIKRDLPKLEALPYRYEAVNDQSENGGLFDRRVSVFARKAGYHYGWDWGPRLVTSGIWRPVYLESWEGPKIEDIFFYTREASAKRADATVDFEISSDKASEGCIFDVINKADGKVVASYKLSLKEGHNKFSFPIVMKNPRLWWCNGLGKPELYDLCFRLNSRGKLLDSVSKRVGIRKIEVVRDEDKDGRSFYFRLNGVPVFAKGANYIPCDNFLPRVNDSIYYKTVKDAADVNMNMLRVWGGGVYEDDRFYNICDSLGIMVWQDFMFACSLYPTEGEMLESIRHEVIDNLKRLRSHPSIVLWCGNNECLEAWYGWGWKNRYEARGYGELIWNQYENLYNKLLPDLVKEYAPDMVYWPSSPYSRNDGLPDPERGDYHLWTVWGQSQPIDIYNQFKSRFFSEYGFQSFPELSTVMKYAPDTASHNIDSDVMLAHQRAGADANRRIEKYLLESYPEPRDFKAFLYMSHVLQGDAIKTAMEAHRRDKPHCMGTLFWQHNDCWPVASWSSRDYYGRWKAQHYFSRKAYDDILVSTIENGDSVDIYIISDRQTHVEGSMKLSALRHDGGKVGEKTCKVKIGKNGLKVLSFPKNKLWGDENPREIILHSEFQTGNRAYESIWLPVKNKEVALLEPAVNIEVTGLPGAYQIAVTSDNFVRALYLDIEGSDSHFFNDNYFDLLPGKTYTVTLSTDLPIEEVRKRISSTSLFDAAKALPASASLSNGL